MYEVIQNLIGPVPESFTFIYGILTLVFGMLLLAFLFQLFYIPIKMIGKW